MAQTYSTYADGVTTKFQLPVAVQATSDITSVLVNGGAGPAVSSVANDIVTLASAPAAGALVAIKYKDRRADVQVEFIETKDRPQFTYTQATHTAAGDAVPGNIVDFYAGSAYLISTKVAADGTFSVVLPTYSGTQLITAVQRAPDPFHASTAVQDGYGVSSVW